MPKFTMLRRVKNILAPMRRRYEQTRRIILVALFRCAVTTARALRILPPAARPTEPPHILLINLTPHLGDTIMLLPLIERLRAAHPSARIDIAVEAGAAPLLQNVAAIDNVYALPLGSAPPITYSQARHRVLAITRLYRHTLRTLRPTVTLNPRWGDDLFRSSILAYLTGAPRRIAFASTVVAPAPYRDKLSTELIHTGHELHEPVRFAALAAASGLIPAASLETITTHPIDSVARIADSIDWPSLRTRLSIPQKPFAIIAPGASMARRIWPIENWSEVAQALIARDIHIVILSGKMDAQIAETLAATLPASHVTLIAGTTSLLESVSLIAHTSFFLGNDSGPGHVAGALGIPTFILFTVPFHADPDGPSAPERVKPAGPHVVCLAPPHCIPPCTTACIASEAHCIKLITPRNIIDQLNEPSSVQPDK
jgi:ADP-heptose:LPS heptosyltransferase